MGLSLNISQIWVPIMTCPDIKKITVIMLPYLKEGQERNVGIVLDLILCLTVGMTGVTALDLFPYLLNHCV